MGVTWCNYTEETALADFGALLGLAIDTVLGDLGIKNKVTPLLNFDGETRALQLERTCAGTPDEHIAFGHLFHFNGTPKNYFWIGKFLYPSGVHTIGVWFPIQPPYNSQWHEKLKPSDGKPGGFFEIWDRESGHIQVVLREPFRSGFFNTNGSPLTGKSKLDILTGFLTEVLSSAP
jgi:hypothetical protein